MTYKILTITILVVFFSAFSFGAENIYTWKNKEGVLNITDYAPPAGAEIIDISPSYSEEAKKILKKQELLLEERQLVQEQNILREKAAQEREKEKMFRNEAKEYLQQAEELAKVKFQRNPYHAITQNKIELLEKKADEALTKAEEAKKQAEIYEKQIERMSVDENTTE